MNDTAATTNMVADEKILLSPVRHVTTHLYGYNFYEESVGFGSAREVPTEGGYMGLKITFIDQGNQVVEQPAARLFAFRSHAAQEIIAQTINDSLR
jgi:hypothetical protein